MSSSKTADRKKKVVQTVKIAQVVKSSAAATNGNAVKNGRAAASHFGANEDPLADQIYRPSDNGYLLYSVGVNGKDDGGRTYDDNPPGDDPAVRMPLPESKQK